MDDDWGVPPLWTPMYHVACISYSFSPWIAHQIPISAVGCDLPGEEEVPYLSGNWVGVWVRFMIRSDSTAEMG